MFNVSCGILKFIVAQKTLNTGVDKMKKFKIYSFTFFILITLLIFNISTSAYEVLYPMGYSNTPAYIKCYSGFSSNTLSAVHNACSSWNGTHSSALVYRNTATHSNTAYPLLNQSNEITKGSRGTNTYIMQTYYTNKDYATVFEADIDINVSFDFGSASTSYDTQSVITHEIGHLLGLGHSQYTSALMYGTINKGTIKSITSDDIAGIAAIY